MKLFEISEAQIDRSTGEVYRHHDRHNILAKYVNDPSVFVHFSDIDKLGINPKSTHNTPIGIYAYPAYYVMDPVRSTLDPFNVPYAGERKYAHVFRVKDLNKCWIIDKQGEKFPDASIALNDINKLEWLPTNQDIILPKLPKFPLEDELSAILPRFSEPFNSAIERAKWETILTERAFRELFISLRKDDYGRAIIANSQQGLLLTSWRGYKSLNHPDDLVWRFVRSVANMLSRERDHVQHLQNQGHMSIMVKINNHASVMWSKVIMNLGFAGVIDNGTGTIHPNEPCQAVFFRTSDLTHLESITNIRDYGRGGKHSDTGSIVGKIRAGEFSAVGIKRLSTNSWLEHICNSVNKIINYGEFDNWQADFDEIFDETGIETAWQSSDAGVNKIMAALKIAKHISPEYVEKYRDKIIHNLTEFKKYLANKISNMSDEELEYHEEQLVLTNGEYFKIILKSIDKMIRLC